MNNVAADIRRCCPKSACISRQVSSSSCQISANNLVILADSAADLQFGLDAVGNGDENGDSLLVPALINRQSWLVHRDKCPLVQSRLSASISQWCALSKNLGVILSPSFRQPSHVSPFRVVCTNHNLVAQRRSPNFFRESPFVHLRVPEKNVWNGICWRERFNTVCFRQIAPQIA